MDVTSLPRSSPKRTTMPGRGSRWTALAILLTTQPDQRQLRTLGVFQCSAEQADELRVRPIARDQDRLYAAGERIAAILRGLTGEQLDAALAKRLA